jgi:polysaccharide biosynthesis PFTS motif protein
MVLKAKRYIASNVDKPYANFLRQLALERDVVIASPELSAPRLLQACIGSISSPFTSTALYFKDQNYPSVYYDPIGVLQKDDPAAHGVLVLSNKAELRIWIEALLNAQPTVLRRTN